MKNKKKLKRIILILFILILILVIATVIAVLALNNDEEVEEETVIGSSGSNINSEKVIPISAEDFFQNYNGNVDEDDVYTAITKVAYYIIDNKQEIDNLDDEDIEEKYLENEEYFKSIGLIEEENFENIIKLAKTIDSDELSFSYTAFDIDTITNLDDGVSVDVIIKYTGIDKITVNLILAMDSETENAIEIDAKA